MSARILIIDDDPLFAEYLVTLLGRAGYTAASVRAGYGALARIAEAHRQRPIRLLIVDLFMPEPDGFEVLRFTRERLPQIPVIGMSGQDSVLLRAMRSLGASSVFQKPLDPARLIAEVHRLLGGDPAPVRDDARGAS